MTELPAQAPSDYPAVPAPDPASLGPRTNSMAIAAVVCIFAFAPMALVCGLVARRQIKETGEAGSGMATAGIICGAIVVLLLAYGIVANLLLGTGEPEPGILTR